MTAKKENYVTLFPEWTSIARFQAEHIFRECGGATAISFLEVVRYLQATDPQGLERIRLELEAKLKKEKDND